MPPLSFPRSDGDASKLPEEQGDSEPDEEGKIHSVQLVGLHEPVVKLWTTKVGAHVAHALNLPDAENCVLEGFPEGYAMYRRRTGVAGKHRTDVYLHGSRTVTRFRSAQEFTHHAVWLFTDETMEPVNCKCPYCTKGPKGTDGAAASSKRPRKSLTNGVTKSSKSKNRAQSESDAEDVDFSQRLAEVNASLLKVRESMAACSTILLSFQPADANAPLSTSREASKSPSDTTDASETVSNDLQIETVKAPSTKDGSDESDESSSSPDNPDREKKEGKDGESSSSSEASGDEDGDDDEEDEDEDDDSSSNSSSEEEEPAQETVSNPKLRHVLKPPSFKKSTNPVEAQFKSKDSVKKQPLSDSISTALKRKYPETPDSTPSPLKQSKKPKRH